MGSKLWMIALSSVTALFTQPVEAKRKPTQQLSVYVPEGAQCNALAREISEARRVEGVGKARSAQLRAQFPEKGSKAERKARRAEKYAMRAEDRADMLERHRGASMC